MSSIARMTAVVLVASWAGAFPASAAAQIASVVRPPTVARAPRVVAPPSDTAQVRHPTTQLTGLTAWVDSAVTANDSGTASGVGRRESGVGTSVPNAAPARHVTAVRSASSTSARFQNGGRAPDTASLLPAIVLVGVLALGAGVGLGLRAFRVVGVALIGVAGVTYGVGLWTQRAAREALAAAVDGARVERRAEAEALRATASGGDVSNNIAMGAPVARLVMPTIGEDDVVLEGVDPYELNGGPGHLPGSALPGETGNAVISAHRDRHFRHLDRLQVGDTVLTYVDGQESVWRVATRQVVSAATPALFSTAAATLTLTTCWPVRDLGPAPDRLIVSAIQVTRHRIKGLLNSGVPE
jgi:LPXTG-site transpeptidase (sortase) family protein